MRDVYSELLRVAGAVSRRRQEAQDLVHAVLLEAIEHGVVDLDAPERRAWLRGAVRRRAAFEARTVARVRRRDARWLEALTLRGEAGGAETPRQPWRFSSDLLGRLAPSLRALAVLASADLQPEEIRFVLRLTDTAFRKRLSMLRRALHDATGAGVDLVQPQRLTSALGKKRAEVLAVLRRRRGWAVASHDPDGHPLIFSIGAHKPTAAGNSQTESEV